MVAAAMTAYPHNDRCPEACGPTVHYRDDIPSFSLLSWARARAIRPPPSDSRLITSASFYSPVHWGRQGDNPAQYPCRQPAFHARRLTLFFFVVTVLASSHVSQSTIM